MIFTKKEFEENYPLEERLKLEKLKYQNSLIYWVNELIQSHVRGAEDVPSLIQVTKDLVMQVESLYQEKESLDTPRSNNSHLGVEGMEEQLVSLYEEKELLLEKTKTKSIDEVIALIQGMEEQLKSLYAEYET